MKSTHGRPGRSTQKSRELCNSERSTGSVDPENPRALTDPAVDRSGRPATEKNKRLFFQAKSVDRDSEPVGRLCQKPVNSKCP